MLSILWLILGFVLGTTFGVILMSLMQIIHKGEHTEPDACREQHTL